MEYIKGIYSRRVQAEIDSYKYPEDEEKNDTNQFESLNYSKNSICSCDINDQDFKIIWS